MGKMFCVVYAIVGIPVLLLYMAHVGDKMGDAFRYAYRYSFEVFFILSWDRIIIAQSFEDYMLPGSDISSLLLNVVKKVNYNFRN